jgi:hypothetical protein
VALDELLRALGDLCEIADAELLGFGERRGEREPRRIGEPPRPRRGALRGARREPAGADRLGDVEIEAGQVAAVLASGVIATCIGTFAGSTRGGLGSLA